MKNLILSLFLLMLSAQSANASKLSVCATLLLQGRDLSAAKVALAPNRFTLSDLNANYQLQDIQNVSQAMLERYPSDSNYFVGLGRSPYIFIDYINMKKPGSALTVPLSYNARNTLHDRLFYAAERKEGLEPFSKGLNTIFVPAKNSEELATSKTSEDPELRERLFLFLDLFFPSDEELKGKAVVLTDFSNHGSSLIKFYVDVRAYLEARNRSTDVKLLFLDNQNSGKSDVAYYTKGNDPIIYSKPADDWLPHVMARYTSELPEWDTINLRKFGKIHGLLDSEKFKRYAPYDHFVIPTSQEAFVMPKYKSNHQIFLDALTNDYGLSL